MRRLALLVGMAGLSLAVAAQKNIDFAEKLMQTLEGDTIVRCITVSPKMMEQIAGLGASSEEADDNKREQLQQAMQKLNSARIVTADTVAAEYYDKALALLGKYSKRFAHWSDYADGPVSGVFYGRKAKKGEGAVEMVMLQLDSSRGTFTAIDLTGDIDEEFIETLTKAFGPNG